MLRPGLSLDEKRLKRRRDRLSFKPWLDLCALRLRERWPSVCIPELELAALEVWFDDRKLNELIPAEAAEIWLEPIENLSDDYRPQS